MADLLIVSSLGTHGNEEAIQKFIAGLKIDTLVPADDHGVDDRSKFDRDELMKDLGSGWVRVGDEEQWDKQAKEVRRARR